jgi:hypothetical protein
MSSILRYASACCLFLVLAGSGILKAVPPGFLEGRLKIISLREVDLAEAAPSTGLAESYEEYPLVILSQDGHREIARVTADGNGAYRVALPPGAYILDVQDRAQKRPRAQPQPFKIESNQTVRVNMAVDAGIPGVR